MGRRNPLTDWAQFFLGERYPWRNQARQIWWRALKGIRGSFGSNFSISHWLSWSSLQHSHTTVWACDKLVLLKSSHTARSAVHRWFATARSPDKVQSNKQRHLRSVRVRRRSRRTLYIVKTHSQHMNWTIDECCLVRVMVRNRVRVRPRVRSQALGSESIQGLLLQLLHDLVFADPGAVYTRTSLILLVTTHLTLSHSKNHFTNFLEKYLSFSSLTKWCSHQLYIKSYYRLYTTAVTNGRMLQQNAVHDQQSVSHWWHKSVRKWKLVYSSLIFVDNKLTSISLLT